MTAVYAFLPGFKPNTVPFFAGLLYDRQDRSLWLSTIYGDWDLGRGFVVCEHFCRHLRLRCGE